MSGAEVAEHLYTMALKHVGNRNILYRIFYYDCEPLAKKAHNPISGKAIDFSKSDEFKFRSGLIEALKKKRKVALRIGMLKDNKIWAFRPHVAKTLLSGKLKMDELTEDDVLFSGDSDFVPAAKLARREGVDFVLAPMHANVEPQLFEHIYGMKSVNPVLHRREK